MGTSGWERFKTRRRRLSDAYVPETGRGFFEVGVQVRGAATYFSRPTPTVCPTIYWALWPLGC